MKKIENWLFLPILVLVFYGASKYSSNTIDIHFHDTYYVVANGHLIGVSLVWLSIVLILFKIIRRRHQSISIRFAIPYLILTLLIFLVFWLPNGAETGANGISDTQLNRWLLYNQLRISAAFFFLLAQVIFLIYFITQLFKRPVVSRQ
jgi:heme/copper-type cytochrome/quinol oxidase subunit 1